MTKFSVSNPTGKGKAVREAGGLTVIKPGEKTGIEASWSDEDLARYEAAGLKVTKPSTKTSEKAVPPSPPKSE